MPSLLDLAPRTQTVRVRGAVFEVHALTLMQVIALLRRHTDLAPVIVSGGDVGAALLDAGDEAVNAVIDAGLRQSVGTAAQANLSAIESGNIALATIEATIPQDSEESRDFFRRLGLVFMRVQQTSAGPQSTHGSPSSHSSS